LDSLASRLEAAGRSSTLAKGEVLFHQDDLAADVFWVHRGRLRLERHLESGVAVTVSVVRAPSILAEAALFFDRYRCRATAETSCRVSRIAKSAVLGMFAEPDFATTFVRVLSAEVRELRTRLELRNIRPASERVLQYLRLRQDQGLPPYDRPLASMAAELGITPEALYRIASRLEREGKIRRRGGRLVLTGHSGSPHPDRDHGTRAASES
jgi:CRP-like cAMP-binding protein